MNSKSESRLSGSRRMAAVQTPIIPMIGELVRSTPDCLSFGQGVAYYDPPQSAFDTVSQHLTEHATNLYGPVEGIPELQQVIREKLAAENGVTVDPGSAIVVTAGSNMAFSSLMTAIADAGDEIILPVPYYFNHEMAIRMVDCSPVGVPTLANFHPDLDALEQAITSRTRAIVTVSPNNPTGAVYSRDELEAVNALCAKYGIYHISDEAYEHFVYDQHRHFSPASIHNAHAHTISLYSFSKSYGFAGWRIGYIVLPKPLLAAYKKVQDTVLISPTIIAQHAATGAMQAGRAFIQRKLLRLQTIRTQIQQHLSAYGQRIRCASGEGAFYLFCQLQTEMEDLALVRRLIHEHGIAVIPGSIFGCTGGCYLRMSYGAVAPQDVLPGITRFTKGIEAILSAPG